MNNETEVLINGVTYIPVTAVPTHGRIGVAVTTHNRTEIFNKTINHIREHLPVGAVLVVVDDASTVPVEEADYRFTKQAGIARAKNKCLELLVKQNVEHFFLFDDDTYPLVSDWWVPYVESAEPHLMRVFVDRWGPGVVSDDGQTVAYTGPRGCMIYVHRSALDTVGGLDPVFGLYSGEHVDWSVRIHNAGLTTFPFMDIKGSEAYVKCLDEDGVERTITDTERKKLVAKTDPILAERRQSKAYVEYREQHNLVLTTWMDLGEDPQRRGKPAGMPPVSELIKSVKDAAVVVLHNCGDIPDTPPVYYGQVPDVGVPVYLQKWVHAYRYLRRHPEVDKVFLVDAGDVQMSSPPWNDMKNGTLYVGYEPKLLGCKWMVDSHPDKLLHEFISANPANQLLNCGVIGGDRETVLEFITCFLSLIQHNAFERHYKRETHPLNLDMGPFNYVAYTYFADRIEWGSRWTSVFKAFEKDNGFSAWIHK